MEVKNETGKTTLDAALQKDSGVAATAVHRAARVVVNKLTDLCSGRKAEYRKEKTRAEIVQSGGIIDFISGRSGKARLLI